MLEMFQSNYYQCFRVGNHGPRGTYVEESLLLGRPYGLAIAAGSDGTGAAKQVSRICRGWRLQAVAPEPLVVRNRLRQTAKNILAPKVCSAEAREQCAELGGLVAA